MKKTLMIAIVGFCLLGISCKKMLDVKNPNTFTNADFWKTEADVEQGLNAVYNMFYKQGTWTRNIYTLMDGSGDDGVSFAGWTELQEWSKFIYTNYNFGETNVKIWQEHYKAIFRANQVLDNVGNVTFSSEEKKNRLTAEAKFLRAFYYFYLEVLYENIPLILKTSSAADLPAQSTPEQVWAQIQKDLEEAIPYLPATWPATDLGRPTKGAAYAYLGKALMQQKKWSEAREALKWLVEGEGKQHYSLVANYGDNFRSATENNSESVFEIQFSKVYNTGFDVDFDAASNLGTQHAMNAAPLGLGWSNVQARRWLVDYYKREKTTDGKNDIRLFENVWYNNGGTDFPDRADTLIYGRTWTEDPSWNQQVFIKKYSADLPGRELEFYWNEVNFRLIRYSDVLLAYAEVLNELEGPTALAVSCVDQVRNRVKLSNLQQSAFYNGAEITSSKDKFREHIKIERGLELALECVRWIDLKRWGLSDAQTINELKSRDPDFNNFIIGKSFRLPLPQSDVDNNPNLSQNTPY